MSGKKWKKVLTHTGTVIGMKRKGGSSWEKCITVKHKKNEDGKCRIKPKEKTAGKIQSSMDQSLASSIIDRRTEISLETHVANTKGITDTNSDAVNVFSLCDTYDDEGYGEMDEDEVRNKAFYNAVNALAKKKTTGKGETSSKLKWVDIGCGASAFLSSIVLDSHPDFHVTALEINKRSAASAEKTLAKEFDESRFEVIASASTSQPIGIEKNSFDILLHELFGFITSSEGCAMTVGHAKYFYSKPEGICIPSRAASLFTLCSISPQDMDAYETVYVTPKLILCHTVDIAKYMLTNKSSFFEYFNFNSKQEGKPAAPDAEVPPTRGVDLVQEYDHEFHIEREGLLNSLCIFIWIDLGFGGSPLEKKPNGKTAFPFGDERLLQLCSDSKKEQNHIGSFFHPKTKNTYASNWMNPILILPKPQQVATGDIVKVTTKAQLDSLTPSYSFLSTLVKGGEEISLGDIHLTYDNLYPDFTAVQ